MIPFKTHCGIAAPMLIDDLNTDVIIPTSRAVHASREQMGGYAFEALRYQSDGRENTSFVLNQPRYRNASILVAGDNFGCGSSREMAVWALQEAGFRCVIAPSFGEIFAGNCIKNGLLPVIVPKVSIETLAGAVDQAKDPRVTVNLLNCTVSGPQDMTLSFEISEAARQSLLSGLDDISQTLGHLRDIEDFIDRDSRERPWIHAGGSYRA